MNLTKTPKKPSTVSTRVLVGSIAALLAAHSPQAANYYWDIDGVTADAGGATPSGIWGTLGTTWSTDSTGSALTPGYTTLGIDDLFFSAGTNATGTYTVTLGASQTAKSLTFQEGTNAVVTANTITLAGGGGITVDTTSTTGATISSGLTINGNNTFNVGSGETLTLNTGAFTRGTRATLNVQGAGTVASSMTGLSALTNGIIGPWASIGTGASTQYATITAGNITALTGTAAATAANVTSTLTTVNYDVAAVGTLGAGASINTLRYTGAAGTIAGGLTTKGIMNAGTGLLTFSGAVTAGAAATELVVNTANANITFSGVLTGTIVKTGSGTMTMGNVANVVANIPNMTVNEGVLITNTSTADGLGGATINSGGTLRFGGSNKHTNSAVFTVNAGGTLDVVGFNDTIGSLSGLGSVTGTSAGYIQLSAATTFAGTINGAMGLRLPTAVTITLSGVNTYTGPTQLNLSGAILNLTNATPMGTIPGTNGTSGISMITGTILASATAGANPSTTIAAPITLSGVGDATLRIGQGAASNTHTFNVNGAIGGTTGNLVFSTATGSFANGASLFVLGAAGTYAGNTLITTGNGSNNPVTVRAGAGIVNALPTTTVLTFGQVAGGGSGRTLQYDLNGNNQTLAGLDNGGVVPSGRNMLVTSSAAATLTINNTANFTFGGANTNPLSGTARGLISGAIALTKSGSGTFTLGGTLAPGTVEAGHTFTGDTKITGGILVLGESLSIRNSTFDTANSIAGDATNGLRTSVTTLTMGGLTGDKNFADVFTTTTGGYGGLTALTLNPATGATPSYSGNITDATTGMTLTKSGAGTQTLTGTNSYTGTTTINVGTLALGGGAAIPDTSLVSIANVAGATLQLNNNETIGNLSGGGLTGGAVNLQANTLTVGDATNSTFSGVISGVGGGLTKQGAGGLTLGNATTYSGATLVSGGTLTLSGSGDINGSSGITINGSGAKLLQNSGVASTPAVTLTQGTLTGNGTVNTVNVGAGTGAIVSNNDGVAGLSLTIGALTFNGSATVNTFNASTSAAIVTTSLSTNVAGSVTITPTGTWTSGATHDLISFGGGSIGGAGGGQFVLGVVGGLSARQAVGTFDTTSTTAIKLTIDGDTPVWSGGGTSTWATAATNDNTGPNDWALKNGNTATNFWATDGVEFNDTYNLGAGNVAVTNTTVTITGGVAPSATIFNNSAVNYTITTSDATGITSGSVTKNGSGMASINTANTYTGGTSLNAGILQIGDASALGTGGTITLGGGTLKYGTGITADLSGRFSTAASQAYKIDTNGNAITFATALTSVGGTLTKEGANTLTLTAANTYTGITAINGGTLQLGDGGTTGGLTGTTGITTTGTVTLAINRSNAFTQATDINGQIINGANLSVTKSGAGDLTLSANNSYDGATILNAGNLFITHNNALGSTVGSTTINGGNGTTAQGLTLTNATSDLTIAENLNFFANSVGRAQLVNLSAQNHTLTGAIDVSSDTNLTQFFSSSTGSITISGDISGTMTNGGLFFLRGVSTNASNRVIGSVNLTGGNLAKTDGGTWLVGASGKSYSWADTQVANGILKMGLANILPSATGLLMGNTTGASTGTLDINGFNQTVASITYNGAGTATGTKTITNSDLVNAAVVTINNATDNTSGNAAGANNIVLTGNLALTKQGAGKLTLLGTNTYTGNTTISGGTLEMASNLIANSPNLSIGNGATLSSTGGFALTAGQNVTATDATGNVTTSSNTGLITAGNNIISNSVALNAGTLTITRLDVRGTGNQITGGDIQSGGAGTNQRGLLIGNGAGSSDLTITGGTLTSNGGGGTRSDVIGNSAIAGSPNATLTINGGNYVNTAGAARTTLGNAGALAATSTLTVTTGSATINELEYLIGSFAGNTATVNLNGGTLTVSTIISTSGANRVFNFNGGQFVAGGAAFAIGSGLTLNVKDGGAKIDTNGNSFAISAPLLNSGTGGLTKSGTGTLTLTGANTYTGTTTVSGGTLQVSGSSAIVNAGLVTLADAAGATFQVVGSETIGALSGGGATGGAVSIDATQTLSLSSGTQTYAGTISGAGALTNSGAIQTLNGALSHSGGVNVTAGVLTLGSASNTYTGGTTVSDGTLLVTGSISGSTSVNSGGTLGGSGGTTGDVTVAISGTIAPGSSIGTLNTGTLAFTGGAFDLELNTTAITTDLANVTGNLALLGGGTLSITDLAGAALSNGHVFTFIDYSGTWDGGVFAGYADDSKFTLGLNEYRISYDGVNNATSAVTLEVVPEPGSAVLLLGGLATLAGLRRRRA